jgi:hypothetical protein
MMSMLCNCCVRELLILARTWFAFGLPFKTGCDITYQLIEVWMALTAYLLGNGPLVGIDNAECLSKLLF